MRAVKFTLQEFIFGTICGSLLCLALTYGSAWLIHFSHAWWVWPTVLWMWLICSFSGFFVSIGLTSAINGDVVRRINAL